MQEFGGVEAYQKACERGKSTSGGEFDSSVWVLQELAFHGIMQDAKKSEKNQKKNKILQSVGSGMTGVEGKKKTKRGGKRGKELRERRRLEKENGLNVKRSDQDKVGGKTAVTNSRSRPRLLDVGSYSELSLPSFP